MKMKVVLSGGIVLLLVLSGMPSQALEPLVLYDDFNTEFISPAKWLVGQEGGPAAREFVREILGKKRTIRLGRIRVELFEGKLRLVDRAYGDTASNSGDRFSGAFLDFPNPDAITAIQVTIQVKKVDVTGCPQNPAVSGAGVRITGSFFNTGTPTPGTFLNDVYAQVRIDRLSNSTDPPNVLRVVSDVGICTAVNCSAGTNIDHDELGTVRVGETIRLLIQWDQDNHRFIFQRDDNPPVVSPYTVSDVTPSGAKRKNLLIGNFAANCTAAPRPVAFMEAFFDNVFVNESAVP